MEVSIQGKVVRVEENTSADDLPTLVKDYFPARNVRVVVGQDEQGNFFIIVER